MQNCTKNGHTYKKQGICMCKVHVMKHFAYIKNKVCTCNEKHLSIQKRSYAKLY